MAAVVTAPCPSYGSTKPDVEHDFGRHMPMALRRFDRHAATGWRAERITGTPTGERPASGVMATLEFRGPAGFAAAPEAEIGPATDDVPDRTALRCESVMGKAVGHG